MSYVLPLEDRMHFAAVQKERYWRDPVFRLRQINKVRARRGKPPLASLDEL